MPGLRATMKEFSKGTLHSGSDSGPTVTSPKQAIAIALSEKSEKGAKQGFGHHHAEAGKAHGKGDHKKTRHHIGHMLASLRRDEPTEAENTDEVDVEEDAESPDEPKTAFSLRSRLKGMTT